MFGPIRAASQTEITEVQQNFPIIPRNFIFTPDFKLQGNIQQFKEMVE